MSNVVYIKQVIRSSGSVGANYVEANEALSKKDFLVRIKICRKETKESAYWIKLLMETNPDAFKNESLLLRKETLELRNIFSSVLKKSC